MPTDNAHLKMRLAEASMNCEKKMKVSLEMPEIEKTYAKLGL